MTRRRRCRSSRADRTRSRSHTKARERRVTSSRATQRHRRRRSSRSNPKRPTTRSRSTASTLSDGSIAVAWDAPADDRQRDLGARRSARGSSASRCASRRTTSTPTRRVSSRSVRRSSRCGSRIARSRATKTPPRPSSKAPDKISITRGSKCSRSTTTTLGATSPLRHVTPDTGRVTDVRRSTDKRERAPRDDGRRARRDRAPSRAGWKRARRARRRSGSRAADRHVAITSGAAFRSYDRIDALSSASKTPQTDARSATVNAPASALEAFTARAPLAVARRRRRTLRRTDAKDVDVDSLQHRALHPACRHVRCFAPRAYAKFRRLLRAHSSIGQSPRLITGPFLVRTQVGPRPHLRVAVCVRGLARRVELTASVPDQIRALEELAASTQSSRRSETTRSRSAAALDAQRRKLAELEEKLEERSRAARGDRQARATSYIIEVRTMKQQLEHSREKLNRVAQRARGERRAARARGAPQARPRSRGRDRRLTTDAEAVAPADRRRRRRGARKSPASSARQKATSIEARARSRRRAAERKAARAEAIVKTLPAAALSPLRA